MRNILFALFFISSNLFADCGEVTAILGAGGPTPDPKRDPWANYQKPQKRKPQPAEPPAPRQPDLFSFAVNSPVRTAIEYIGIKYTGGIPKRKKVEDALTKKIEEFHEMQSSRDHEDRDLAKDMIGPIRRAIEALHSVGLTERVPGSF